MESFTRRTFIKIVGTSAGVAAVKPQNVIASMEKPLIIKCFTPDGKPMPKEKLEPMILYDPGQDPFNRSLINVRNGVIIFWIPDKPFCPSIPFPVTNYGSTWVHVDNGGEGYAPDSVPNPFHFNFEFAKSRALDVRRYVDKHIQRGCTFSSELLRRLESAEIFVQKASAESDDAEKARLSDTSLTDSMWAGDMAVFEKAKFDIQRQGYRPEFKIGCNGFLLNQLSDSFIFDKKWIPYYPYKGDELRDIEKAFERLCNFATLPFYRIGVEREQGRYVTSHIDRILDWISTRNITPKGHPLVWLNNWGYPPWMLNYSYDEAVASHKRYIMDMVGKYKDRIKIWDVINEANDVENYLYPFEKLIDITRVAVETTKLADPSARTVVNVNTPFSEHAAYENPRMTRDIKSTLTYFRELANAGVPWDVTGIQHYWYGRDMFEMDKHLDIYGRFGKPVHITEIGLSSNSAPDERDAAAGRNIYHWHGTEWTEAVQADWAEQFYTICYSKPHLEALTWWDLQEGFWAHGGLLRKDRSPKPAYFRILSLRESWEKMK